MRIVKALVVLAFPLFALAILNGCGNTEAQESTAAPAPIEVTVAEVITRPLADRDEFTGRLEAVNSVELRPRVGGYIESVSFTEGSRVQKGQLLFQIDPRPYRAEVARLTAEQQRAKAQAQLAAGNRDRAQRLLDQNAIAREEYDRLATEAAATAANVGAVDASLDVARLNLEFTRITAPISGRVSRAMITAGNLVSSADLLTTLVSDDPIYAYFSADEQTYLRYASRNGSGGASGNSVHMGLTNEQGYPRPGKLDFIDNRLDPGTGTIRGRAVFANPDGALTPGLFARVRLVAEESRERILIDDRAIGADLGKKFVLVLAPENRIEYRGITLGAAVDSLRIVESGLNKGDVIVVNGLQHAKPGEQVTPVRTAMGDTNGEALRQTAAVPAPSTVARSDAAAGRSGVLQ